jgi:dynein heavy chain
MHFFDIVKRACHHNFHQQMDKILADHLPQGERTLKESHVRGLFFGNYMEPDADPKIYDEVNHLILETELHEIPSTKNHFHIPEILS